FAKPERAFMQIAAGDADQIYGDSYQVKGKAVEGIGNNVTLEFAGMNFGPGGAGRLVVYGRTPLEKNTIHLLFRGEEGESRQIIEFPHTEEYEERLFTLERITGEQKVSFVFLPGSNFDFGWFRFER
ncbi:MAG TPA: glycoside hydrolase family 2, partial [Firmicutes bacterium]|nr:glycoside hydrolase family 2 [Bacillota bacterium]